MLYVKLCYFCNNKNKKIINLQWNCAFECYRLFSTVIDCFWLLSTVFDCYRLLSTVFDCFRLLSTVFDCYRLLSTVFNCFRLFSTVITVFDCFRLIFDQSYRWLFDDGRKPFSTKQKRYTWMATVVHTLIYTWMNK